jgi:hypothetical protein
MNGGKVLIGSLAEVQPERVNAGEEEPRSSSGEALAVPTVATTLA